MPVIWWVSEFHQELLTAAQMRGKVEPMCHGFVTAPVLLEKRNRPKKFPIFFAHVRQHNNTPPATGKDLSNETEEEISKKRGEQRNHKKEHKMRNMMKHDET